MRKFYFLIMMFTVLLFTSCSKCSNKSQDAEEANDTLLSLNVENITGMNKQEMFNKYGKGYTWFETCVTLKDFIDSEDCDGTVSEITNVFQTIDNLDSKSYDVHVIFYNTTTDTITVDDKKGFWIEDLSLNDEQIKLTFNDAFDNLQKANVVKPHSKKAVLRKELGPINTNAQWIFGNSDFHVYVDVVTGDVTVNNPVYPKDN